MALRYPISLPMAAVMVGLCVAPLPVKGLSISSNHNMNGGAVVLQGSGESIVPSAGPVYSWTDNNGDGVTNGAGDDATADLNLGSYKIYTDNGTNITLRLLTSAGKGNITGNSGVTNLSTARPGNYVNSAGSLAIYDVDDLDMGGIDTSHQMISTSSPIGGSGSLTIGEATSRAGHIRADFLRTGWVLPDGTWGNAKGWPGNLTIHSSGNVRVQTSGGVAGDVTVWCLGYENGRLAINHDGEFRVNHIQAQAGAGYTATCRSRSVTLNGDVLVNGASGGCQILGSLSNEQSRITAYGANNEGIQITGYTNVSVAGNITCDNASSGAAGNLLISNITSGITIGGEITLNAPTTNVNDGSLTLHTSGGKIYLGKLDLEKVKSARFSAGLRRTWITGVLTNFTGENDSKLMVPADQMIYYDPEFNPALSNQTYRLRNWAGVADAGGVLRPVPIPGTLVIFR